MSLLELSLKFVLKTQNVPQIYFHIINQNLLKKIFFNFNQLINIQIIKLKFVFFRYLKIHLLFFHLFIKVLEFIKTILYKISHHN